MPSGSMIGKVVGNYRIVEYLGSGEFGDVYKGKHLELDLFVAIKFIRENLLADAPARQQFLRGAGALAKLDHPNICRFYEIVDPPKDRIHVVMSLCEGETLQAKIARGRLDIKEAVEIARDIASGLSHAHKRKVIHRDIKPSNLMFDKEGLIKLVDFGLAKVSDATASSGGGNPGTLLYMAPEQLNGDPVDGRAEIFSLGDVLYEMLTGTHPFHAERPPTIVFRICNDYPRPLNEVLPDAPESLQQVLNRALQKDPQARYQTAEEMRENLQTVLEDGVLKPQKPRQPKARWIAAIASVVVVAAIVAWFYWPPPVPSPLTIGVAVFAAEQDAGSAEERALVNGFAHDLSDRVRVFARRDTLLWAVTPDRIMMADLRTPARARGILGANVVVTVRSVANAEANGFELQSYNVASPAVAGERLTVALLDVLNSESIDESLRRMIGVTRAVPTGGYTTQTGAYRDYLIGLGFLDTRPPGLDRAVLALERAIAADSTFARAWAAIGDAYRVRFNTTKDGDWLVRAGVACDHALKLYSELPEALVTKAQIKNAQKRQTEAIDAYQLALALDPRNNMAYWGLAAIHQAAGHNDDAERAYRAAVDANPDDPGPAEWLGYFFFVAKDYDKAIAPLERVSRLAPMNGQNMNVLGACYFKRDCWEEAITAFKRSFALERNFAACSNLGTLYYLNHQFEDAAGMYQWAREYHPTRADIITYLADCRYWTADRTKAMMLYDEAVTLAEKQRVDIPDDAYHLALLAGLYSLTKPDSVTSVADRAVLLAQNDADIHFRVAVAFELVGEREKALKHVARALDLGYSVRQIEAEPFLDELRKDQRYQEARSSFEIDEEPRCEEI